MIRGTLSNTFFQCDRCGKRALGRQVPTKATGTGVYIEPEGWYKAIIKRDSGTVIRHYCEECQKEPK